MPSGPAGSSPGLGVVKAPPGDSRCGPAEHGCSGARVGEPAGQVGAAEPAVRADRPQSLGRDTLGAFTAVTGLLDDAVR